MQVTLLGSGEAVGVPAPLCDCRYCDKSSKRRRPGLLVETEETTVVFDVNPGVKDQLHETDTPTVDAFFLTHHHFDHVGGMHELSHAAMGFDTHVGIEGGYLPSKAFAESEKPPDPEFAVYLTETALGHIRDAGAHLMDNLDFRTIDHGDTVTIGDIRVVPFPVRHAPSSIPSGLRGITRA